MLGFGGLGARAQPSSRSFLSRNKRLTPSAPMQLSPSTRMAARVSILAAAAAFSGLAGDPARAHATSAGRGGGGRAALASSSSSSSPSSTAGVCSSSSAADPSASTQRWSVRRTAGDGACLFRAVVQGASLADRGQELSPDDEERQSRFLRQQVVQALIDYRDDIAPFLPGIALDFESYCARMSMHSTWGGEPELVMAAQHVLRRPLAVYSARLGDQLARAAAAASSSSSSKSNPGDDDDAAGGLPPPVVTYGEDFLSDPSAPHVVRLLWSGNHYETLVDEHRARRLRERVAGGGKGDGGDGGGDDGGSRSRL